MFVAVPEMEYVTVTSESANVPMVIENAPLSGPFSEALESLALMLMVGAVLAPSAIVTVPPVNLESTVYPLPDDRPNVTVSDPSAMSESGTGVMVIWAALSPSWNVTTPSNSW